MSEETKVMRYPDPEILGTIRSIIIYRAEEKGLIKSSDFVYGFIEDTSVEKYLRKFDYLDIMEIGMLFEEEYKKKTKKEFFISEQAFNVLYKTRKSCLEEFCYVLHCCTEGKPVISEPTKAEKLKAKFVETHTKIKNLLSQKFANIRAK